MTTKSMTATEKLEKLFGKLTFGSFLRSWRMTSDSSQTEFAKQLGLSVQNLNDLEKGRRIPSPSRAAKIAKKLKLPETGLIELALRDTLSKEGFRYQVALKPSAS